MSSPFRYFRKHTKAFMAVAAVMCMFLFVFASGTGGGGRNSDDQSTPTAKVATWNGGSLNEGQLSSLIYQRQLTNEFLQMLFVTGGGRTGYDLPRTVPNFLLPAERPDEIELDVINTEVFSSLATDAGMTVSDAMINHYLAEFGLKRVNSDDIRGLLARAGQGSVRGNEEIVFSMLRKLLLADFYRRAFDDAGAVVLPEQRWEDWRRVNERISLQVAKLPVEKFLDQVPEPTEAQLKRLYDQYREAEPNTLHNVVYRQLPSPNPGFAESRRIKLQYLVGSVVDRTQKLLETVSEEAIADYYERNKRRDFVKTEVDGLEDFDNETPAADDATSEGAAGQDADASGSGADAVSPDAASSDAAPADATPEGGSVTTEEPAEGNATGDATDPASSSTDDTNVPAPATPSDSAGESDEAAPESGNSEPAPGESDQSSNGRQRSPFRLTALQAAPAEGSDSGDVDAAGPNDEAAEPAAPAEADDASQEKATEPATSDDAAPADGEVADDANNSAAPAVERPNSASDAADSVADGDDSADAGAADAGAAGAADDQPVEYLPLDEVRDQIRETLARDKAVEQLQEQMGEALAKLQSEYNQYGRRVVENRELKRDPPAPPEKLKSLEWLAAEYGLTTQATEALTPLELFETPVGKAVDDQSGRVNVTQAAMSMESYEPFLAKELEGDWYLVTKTEDTPKRIPAFEEVRDKVAAAWKRIEAAKFAEKKAEDLAEASETATESFEEFFKREGYDVVPQTALFSWRNYPLGPGMGYPPELSEAPELRDIGPDFMEAAFRLVGGETEGVMNYDRSEAYVIRLATRQYSPEELKKLFLAEDRSWPGRADMLQERQYGFGQLVNQRIWKDLADFKFDEEWEKRREERLAERN